MGYTPNKAKRRPGGGDPSPRTGGTGKKTTLAESLGKLRK